jgi:hypothetical protein
MRVRPGSGIRRVMSLGMAVAVPFIAACTSRGSSNTSGGSPQKKLSIPQAEAGLAKMFSDDSGKATFSCTDGGGRYDFICQGRYVPVSSSESVVAHRIGASVSHYFEGEPVFAIAVLRDGTASR